MTKNINHIEVEQIEDSGKNGVLFLMVSLFLSILCFFILLNSIAQINTKKSKQIANNVNYEFNNENITKKLNFYSKNSNNIKPEKIGGIFEEGRGNFEDFKKYGNQVKYIDGRLFFESNINQIFIDGDKDLRNVAIEYLSVLGKELDRISATKKIEITMIFDNPDLAGSENIVKVKNFLVADNKNLPPIKIFTTESPKNKYSMKSFSIIVDGI